MLAKTFFIKCLSSFDQNTAKSLWQRHFNLTRQIRDFKSFDQGLRLIIPHMYIAIVQTCQHPRLSGMHVHTFNTVWTSRELALVTRRYSKIMVKNRKYFHCCMQPFKSQPLSFMEAKILAVIYKTRSLTSATAGIFSSIIFYLQCLDMFH